MVKVEGGVFEMGSEDIDEAEKPVHSVKLHDFHLCRFPVTQSLWLSVLEENPATFPHPHKPIETVTWYDAVSFCNALSEKRGLNPYYDIDPNRKDPNNHNEHDDLSWWVRIRPEAEGYRLPTEAEWEYAAQGGKYAQEEELLYAGSRNLTEVAWHGGNSLNMSQSVRLKRPNALGLYDMSGNVDEWCEDWYEENYYEECRAQGVVDNPAGPEQGEYRVVRGGSWDNFDVNILSPGLPLLQLSFLPQLRYRFSCLPVLNLPFRSFFSFTLFHRACPVTKFFCTQFPQMQGLCDAPFPA